ncbi:MAG: hypothetical protein M3O46_12275 [Myxococcota bacterium]|nr:hypothetical protein [Myxococcota bacterium]
MRVNQRLDEAASLARKLLILIESARARESSDRILATAPEALPSSGPGTSEPSSPQARALQAYVEGRLLLAPADARVVDDAIARLMRAADEPTV